MPASTRLLCAALAALLAPACAGRVPLPSGVQPPGDANVGKGTLTDETPMARLPGGTYAMGKTGRRVTVQPFLLDVTAVTVAAYEACARAGRCTAPQSGGDCNWGRADRMKHPVNCVDWQQAMAYCAAVGKRLPTEEEREWAARGAERGTKYPWGDDEPRNQLCWDGGDVRRRAGGLGTCEVGGFPKGDSPQGLKDLAGNVWEWTSTEDDSSVRVAGESMRVYFGGSWEYAGAAYFAASNRHIYFPTLRGGGLGFRCARTP